MCPAYISKCIQTEKKIILMIPIEKKKDGIILQ